MNYETSYEHSRLWSRFGLMLAVLFLAALALALATPWISAATAHDDDHGQQVVAREDDDDDDGGRRRRRRRLRPGRRR